MSTMVKISHISRLEVVCKNELYAFAPPVIELIYIVEKHNALVTINCVGGVSGGGMPVQGKNPGKAKDTFHVSALEIEGGHLAGGTGTVTAV